MSDFEARANDVLAALDVWIKENRHLPDTGLEGQAFLKAAIAAALQAAHDEAIEEAAGMLDMFVHSTKVGPDRFTIRVCAGKVRALKPADRRGEGGGA